MEIVLRARRTLNVLRPARLPISEIEYQIMIQMFHQKSLCFLTYEAGEVTREYHKKVEPIPCRPKVCVIVQDESFGHAFYHHFKRVDPQKNEPRKHDL